MSDALTSLRELLATGPLATVATIDPDGSPHVTLSWAGFDGDEIVMATFFNLGQRKLQNLRRDPRVVLSFHAKEYEGQGLWPYAVIHGRADSIGPIRTCRASPGPPRRRAPPGTNHRNSPPLGDPS